MVLGLRAVIFDFHGVIVDDEPWRLELFRIVLAEEGVGLTDEDYREKYLGYDDRGCFVGLDRRFGHPIQRTGKCKTGK